MCLGTLVGETQLIQVLENMNFSHFPSLPIFYSIYGHKDKKAQLKYFRHIITKHVGAIVSEYCLEKQKNFKNVFPNP